MVKMNRKGTIAVSASLGNIRAALKNAGYDVVDIEEAMGQADAMVISGIDTDMSGVQAISTEVPVLDATGKSADDIVAEVETRMRLR
ncbi:MAG TPA: YkuS family protein [Firmicutes bacterium]|nr:YkuS family protein [Bacillota bacterium]